MIYLLIPASIAVIYGICYIVYLIMQPRYAKSYTWHIKKGAHYCSLWQRIVFCMFWIGGWKFTARSMEYTMRFNNTMVYDFNDGEEWYCKHCGCDVSAYRVTYDEHHDVCGAPVEPNECNKNQDDWNKSPGFQKWFDKLNRTLYGWRSKTEKMFQVTWYKHDNSKTPSYGTDESDIFNAWFSTGIICKIDNPYSFATPLFVYFGGDEVAPHDMDITITGMVVK